MESRGLSLIITRTKQLDQQARPTGGLGRAVVPQAHIPLPKQDQY
jgi:hypothetical protein